MRLSKIANSLLLLSFLSAAVVPAQATADVTMGTFDVPGSAGTAIYGINRAGAFPHSAEMVGTYYDLSGGHSFLYSGGKFTQLDVPTPPGQAYPYGTVAYGINGKHQIVGAYHDGGNGAWMGFLYYGGRYTALKQCSRKDYQDFEPSGINNAGIYVGTQQGDSATDNLFHYWGFVQGPAQCAAISVPGAMQTQIHGVNNSGLSVGSYTDVNGQQHGATFFAPSQTGVQVTTLDCPGSTATVAEGVNDYGVIAGYCDAPIRQFRGRTITRRVAFVYCKGVFTIFNFHGASKTEVHGINNPDPVTGSYDVVGSYYAGGVGTHGFFATISPLSTQAAGIRRSRTR